MEEIVLYSGSSGNATLIKCGGANILIDAGKSCLALKKAIEAEGLTLDSIDAVFVTHEHTDHISALEVLCKKYKTPVHITEQSATSLYGYAAECAVVHTVGYTESLGGVTVESFPLPHDSRAHVGYRVTCGGESFGLATDMGCITREAYDMLAGCENVVIEANHDIDMLRCGPYPYPLKKRILSNRGHLSNKECGRLAYYLAGCGTLRMLLAHISAENNTPSAAYTEVRRALDEGGYNDTAIMTAGRSSRTGFETCRTSAGLVSCRG